VADPEEAAIAPADTPDPMRSNLELIGRHDVNDAVAIYSLIGHQEPEGTHAVEDACLAEFTWDYDKGARPKLDKLYEKAKNAQWNGRTDLPWETEVDQEAIAREVYLEGGRGNMANPDLTGTSLETWGEKEWIQFNVEQQNWTLSQFMHGEQGALLCTAKIVETVPWIDAKYYAATQVVDEARHVEVFSRYLNEKCSGHYQVNGHLGLLLDDIIADPRWDMTYLGMQVMVEGLALAAFSFMHQLTPEPLLKKLLQEFAYEAAVRMRDRMAGQEVWDRLGISPKEAATIAAQDPQRNEFSSVLFSKIVPNCKKLGLLDAADGWLRAKFTEMGVIAFEHYDDTTLEIDQAAEGSPAQRTDL